MRSCSLFGLALLAVLFTGCPRSSDAPAPMAAVESFPEPKASEERTAFQKVVAKKKELADKKAAQEAAQKTETEAFVAKHPGVGAARLPGEDGARPDISPEMQAAERELGQINRKHGKLIRDTNVETIKFMNEEYFPALLKYAEYCHKTFVAEPNQANGGELMKLVEQLYDNHNLDEAFLYANDLIKNGFESEQVYDLATASAYCTDHFAEALENWDKAQQKGQYTRSSLVTNREEILQGQKAWETEQQVRTKEAAADDLPRVKLETEVGDLVYELYENEAPETVGNFISLVESGYYDNTDFYSVVLTSHYFHGCKTGDNRSDPGYRIYDEHQRPDRRYPFRGALTMFTAGENRGGAIYTISVRPSPQYLGYSTTFGRLIEGHDVLAKVAKFNLRFPTAGMEPTKVLKVTVVRKRDHEYVPHKVE